MREVMEMDKCDCGNPTFMVQVTYRVEDKAAFEGVKIPINAQLICLKCGSSDNGFNLDPERQ